MGLADVLRQDRGEMFARLLEHLTAAQLRRLEAMLQWATVQCPGCIVKRGDWRVTGPGPYCRRCLDALSDGGRVVIVTDYRRRPPGSHQAGYGLEIGA